MGGESDTVKKRGASNLYSKDSGQNTDINSLVNTVHEYECETLLSCRSGLGRGLFVNTNRVCCCFAYNAGEE